MVLAETKINHEFPSAQFNIENYEIRNRRDRNKFGGGLIEYIKRGVICKQINEFEGKNNEIICSVLTVSKIKWIVFTIYRPPYSSNIVDFFSELEHLVEQAFLKCSNIIIMGDINIDLYDSNDNDCNKLKYFCDVFDFTNLIKDKTCFTKNHQSSIDVILTNKPKHFQHTLIFETGLSDCHMMISTSFKTKLVRLKPKIIAYRKTKNFNVDEFLNEIQNANFVCNTSNADANYDNLINSFSKIVDKHAPIKHRTLRGNQAPFMTRELRKAIYNRSRLKNRQLKNPSTENRLNYKKQRNKCVSLRKKAMKTYFYTITNSGIISNKIFWNTVNPISPGGGYFVPGAWFFLHNF